MTREPDELPMPEDPDRQYCPAWALELDGQEVAILLPDGTVETGLFVLAPGIYGDIARAEADEP